MLRVLKIHPKVPERPQVDEVWAVGARRLRIWVTPEDQPPYRPYLILVLDMTNERIVGQALADHPPDAEAIFNALQQAIRKPAPGGGKARRPTSLLIEEAEWAEALAPTLAKLGIVIEVTGLPITDEFAREISQMMNDDQPESPGLLDIEGVTPEYAAHLFSAAAAFYRAEPWLYFSSDEPIAIRVPSSAPQEQFVSVMGMGGTEYGVAIYREWGDFLKIYLQEGDTPEDLLSEAGQLTVMFDDVSLLPINDSEAVEAYGWEIADQDAYPLFMVFHRGGDHVRRPTRQELELIEATLLATTRIAEDMAEEGDDAEQTFDMQLTLNTFAGQRDVTVRSPAGDLPVEARSAVGFDWDDDEEDDDWAPPDMRITERSMAQLARAMGAEPLINDPKLEHAQELMYEAFESGNLVQRIRLAHKALSISPNCADAWVLLAEEEADTLGRRLEYYRRGVEAGERALGRDLFAEVEGHFWSVLETRPYMRARFGVVTALLELNRTDEAIAECREMLRLNPNDNQGVRYILLNTLMNAGHDDEARELIRQYEDEASPYWTYTSALLTFRAGGKSKQADKLLRQALKFNKHVPDYLTGRKRIPAQSPDYVEFGGEDEAIEYARAYLNHWRRTPGALEWLKATAK
jgi:tetratricopeptide (TPR) repeat protein